MSSICSSVIMYVFLILSAWEDIRFKRIPGGAAAVVFGLGLLAAVSDDWMNAVWYLIRFGLFAAPFFLLFLIRMTGGGDWKLFGLVGALGGWPFAGCAVLAALLMAGIWSAVCMIRSGRLCVRFRIFFWYCRRCRLDHRIYRYPVVKDEQDEIRLGIFVLLGAVLVHLYLLRG